MSFVLWPRSEILKYFWNLLKLPIPAFPLKEGAIENVKTKDGDIIVLYKVNLQQQHPLKCWIWCFCWIQNISWILQIWWIWWFTRMWWLMILVNSVFLAILVNLIMNLVNTPPTPLYHHQHKAETGRSESHDRQTDRQKHSRAVFFGFFEVFIFRIPSRGRLRRRSWWHR